MTEIGRLNYFKNFLEKGPIILLFVSVFNEFDFNYLNLKYFSFNFPFILIYYWSLKRPGILGYGLIFLSGLFNDSVTGLPFGISSFAYLLICFFSAYLRNITLRPNIIKDWFFFGFTVLVVNTLKFSKVFKALRGCVIDCKGLDQPEKAGSPLAGKFILKFLY